MEAPPSVRCVEDPVVGGILAGGWDGGKGTPAGLPKCHNVTVS